MSPRPQPTLRLALRELALLGDRDPEAFCAGLYYLADDLAARARYGRGPYAAAAERAARALADAAREYARIADELAAQPQLPFAEAA